MSGKKYPTGLLVIGFLTNVLLRYFWLFVPAAVLLIVGCFYPVCLYIGAAILLLDIVLSLVMQLKIRKAFLAESDNSDFKEFQQALSEEGDWKENVEELVSQKITDAEDKDA